jgi:integrase/recombinase XerC
MLAVEKVLSGYAPWLQRQPLAKRSREAYLAQVKGFVSWLAGSEHGAQALSEEHVRDWAVRDYKRYVKTTKKWAPTSVNQALAAIDNFYRSLSVGRPDVAREKLPQVAPRALPEADQRSFLRAVERRPSARDRAIATVFFYTALRLAELAALDIDDVSMSARRGRLRIRSGKADAYREVPLNSACGAALQDWVVMRARQVSTLAAVDGVPGGVTAALWLSRSGNRLTSRAIDLVIRRLATDAGLELSAHVLRHTSITNLVRSGADVVLVAEIAGHRRLDTTRRYSLPSDADRDAAVEAVLVEI